MASSSSSRNWVYDVFPSFSGEDIRVTFLSHFLKELDRKLITAFKDNEIERCQSLDPELKKAIQDSRIAVVVFSKNYASSSWCLNELLEIVKCKEELGQLVIPIFYRLDPSHVRKQTGNFGRIFEVTCKNKTEEEKNRWRKALTDVANILGYHSVTWDNEAKMIEEIANNVLGKLLLTSSKDSKDLVGIEDHIAKMSVLLQLESGDVKMVGIWGASGIGKTTIARALFHRISRHFQGSLFIDKTFVSKTTEIYSKANPDDYNMKLHLQGNFLSKILEKNDVKIDNLGALGERLKRKKVLIVIDDLDDLMVLKVLAGQTQWFGSGSRIIGVTNDKHLLMAHQIDCIYEVGLPSEESALEMLCQSAFHNKFPPEGFEKLVVEVARHAGSLPLGLNVLGSSLKGRDKEYWMDMLPRLQNSLDGKIEKILRVSYDGLGSEEDKAIFRHIACLFIGVAVKDIKLLLADSALAVSIGLKHLVDKSLIHVKWGNVEMHRLLQEMGRNIVRKQSVDKPEKREFLVDSKDIYDVLNESIGTVKILGISLDIDEIDELHVNESAFKGMRNLRFLEIYSKKYTPKEDVRLHLPESFDYLPPTLKLLCWPRYPMRCMPLQFRPQNLIKLIMKNSKLEKLWEGVVSLTHLKKMDLEGSKNLREIPDLSKAINLEKLNLMNCWSLVELPSSIQYLNKLTDLYMAQCTNLETLPTGMNLKSLSFLNFNDCSRLRTFPEISTNISGLFLYGTAIEEFPFNLRLENLDHLRMTNLKTQKLWKGVQPLTPLMAMLSPTLRELWLSDIPSLVELPTSFQNLHTLKDLSIIKCKNLEVLPTGINLKFLNSLHLSGCSRLTSFPDISTNVSKLKLSETAIEEVPWWIENFSKLQYLHMTSCSKLKYVHLDISKLIHLEWVNFYNSGALTGVNLSGCCSSDKKLPAREDASYSLPKKYSQLEFIKCFSLDQDALLQQQTAFVGLIFPGEEVPSYFTHRTTGTSLTNIPLPQTSHSQPFFSFRACALFAFDSTRTGCTGVNIHVYCQFKGRFGGSYDSYCQPQSF